MHPGEEFKPLMDAIYRDKVRRARQLTPSERLHDGCELSDLVVERMKAGVRIRRPDADDAECLTVVREQLARLRRLHERGLYQPLPTSTP